MLQALEVSKPEGLRALYETLASKTDMQAPAADFEGIAAEVRSLEEKYRKTEMSVVRVEKPRVLCASSEAYAEIGFDEDVEVLENFFPGNVVVERKLTSRRLRQLLTTERFDHLVSKVDLVTGDLILRPRDRMAGRGFATLLGEAKSELVVLGTCHALSLAVEVAQITNVIATAIDIDATEVAAWAEVFYEFLASGNSLYKAFNLTGTQNDTPMRLVRRNDVLFGRKGALTRAAG